MIQISSLFLSGFPRAIRSARGVENKCCHDRLGNETVRYIVILQLGMWSAEDGIDHTFLDIEELTRKCRFSDCSHENETGCAVRQAVKDGLIAEERYRAYMKLKAENAYNKNAVDYLAAKKRKFKQIAKLNKHNYKQ